MPRPYIVFKNAGVEKHITVIGQQAYYQTVGTTARLANIWFPFIMFKTGVIPAKIWVRTTPEINEFVFNHVLFTDTKKFSPYTIIPLSKSLTNPEYINLDIAKVDKILEDNFIDLMDENDPNTLKGRLVNKYFLINSIRLSPRLNTPYLKRLFSIAAELNSAEQEALDNSIVFNNTPEFTTTDPLKVNLWLVLLKAYHADIIYTHNQNMALILAEYATFDMYHKIRAFVTAYTNNLLSPCDDPLIIEATTKFFELHDATARFVYRQIQDETPMKKVMANVDLVTQEVISFVTQKISVPLSKNTTEKISEFCFFAKKRIDEAAAVADLKRKPRHIF